MRDAHRYCFTYLAAVGWAEPLFTAGAALLDQLGEELLAEEAPAERESAERDRVAERRHAARDEAERGARGGEEHLFTAVGAKKRRGPPKRKRRREHHQRRRGARDLRQHAELQHHRTQNDASAHPHQARHHPGDGGARQSVRRDGRRPPHVAL